MERVDGDRMCGCMTGQTLEKVRVAKNLCLDDSWLRRLEILSNNTEHNISFQHLNAAVCSNVTNSRSPGTAIVSMASCLSNSSLKSCSQYYHDGDTQQSDIVLLLQLRCQQVSDSFPAFVMMQIPSG